jgi:hypothetical protein
MLVILRQHQDDKQTSSDGWRPSANHEGLRSIPEAVNVGFVVD